jgi:hypothetical protein
MHCKFYTLKLDRIILMGLLDELKEILIGFIKDFIKKLRVAFKALVTTFLV